MSNASMDDWLQRMSFVSQVWPVKDSSDESEMEMSNASMDDWLQRMSFVSQVWPVKDSSDESDKAGAK